MPDWFVKADTRDVEIVHPKADEEIAAARKQLEADGADEERIRTALELIRQEHTETFKLRPLNAGDIASINEIKVGAAGASMMIGEGKMIAVELALTAWTLPSPITRDTIRQLNALVLERIFEEIDIGEGASANGTGASPTRPAEEPDADRAKVAAASD